MTTDWLCQPSFAITEEVKHRQTHNGLSHHQPQSVLQSVSSPEIPSTRCAKSVNLLPKYPERSETESQLTIILQVSRTEDQSVNLSQVMFSRDCLKYGIDYYAKRWSLTLAEPVSQRQLENIKNCEKTWIFNYLQEFSKKTSKKVKKTWKLQKHDCTRRLPRPFFRFFQKFSFFYKNFRFFSTFFKFHRWVFVSFIKFPKFDKVFTWLNKFSQSWTKVFTCRIKFSSWQSWKSWSKKFDKFLNFLNLDFWKVPTGFYENFLYSKRGRFLKKYKKMKKLFSRRVFLISWWPLLNFFYENWKIFFRKLFITWTCCLYNTRRLASSKIFIHSVLVLY